MTVFGCALALERNPEAAAAIVAAGHDICCHGWRWEKHWLLSEAEERDHIARAVASIEQTTGQRPLGWYCRTGPSVNTRRLILEHGGFLYDSDSYADELPYWLRENRPAPSGHTVHDGCERQQIRQSRRVWQRRRISSPISRTVSTACIAKGAERPGMMSVGLHMRLAGRPGRAEALRRFLDYLQGFPDIWVCKRIDIARHWITHHPCGS